MEITAVKLEDLVVGYLATFKKTITKEDVINFASLWHKVQKRGANFIKYLQVFSLSER
jgi:hypothetical protein